AEAAHDARADRELRGRELESLARQRLGDAVELEHDPTRLHPADPVLRAALARAHADLGRLLRHRHVREDADPDAADALYVARDGAPRRLDLTRGDAARLDGLEAVGAEIERGAALREAVNAAFVRLAVLGSPRLQHRPLPRLGALAATARGAGALLLERALFDRHRVVRHDLALAHPNLDAARAVGRLRRRDAEIDVGAQRVQRHAALAVPLHARNLGAAETAGAIDPDSLRAE